MGETRQTFANLQSWEVLVWYSLAVISTMVFAWGVLRLVGKYTAGRGPFALDRPLHRAARATGIVFAHSWIRRRSPTAGLGHMLIFYGFLVLFVGSAILAFQDDVAKPLLRYEFWRGWFYLGFSLFLDVFGGLLLIGLVIMAVQRGVVRPARLDYQRPARMRGDFDRRKYVIGDWIFVGGLGFLAFTGFLLEALRIAEVNPPFEVWSPIGWLIAQGLRGLGLQGAGAEAVHHVLWWMHGLVALSFVSAIPFTKAVHMLTGPAGVAVRDETVGKRLPSSSPKPAPIGYANLTDFNWQHLLDLDACTKCGKCHEACPATASGYPLSPRDLVLDLREMAEGSLGIRSALGIAPTYGGHGKAPILGGVIQPETVWSCMSCMACVEICPVGIEHVPIITQLRRQLVEQGNMDSQLQTTLEKVYTTGNSFGEPRRKRMRWTNQLPFEVKDIRSEPAEYLWFVGDYASFDPRNQRVTQSLATILQRAGVDFGILHDAEKTSGCDVRRVGEEGLFKALAVENIKTISQCKFDHVFSSDPHSYHTLKNEYPSLGGTWDVLHHSELLLRLLASKAIVPAKLLNYTVTYHDPCMLGRYNGVYEAPREVLRMLGVDLREMPRNRDNSFCCGAGGGRIWMKEMLGPGARRPSEQRIDEAISLGGIQYFVVACPKDVAMYEDAIKTSGHQGRIELRELSELVLEALDPKPIMAGSGGGA